MLLCLFILSGLKCGMIAQGVGVGEEEPTEMLRKVAVAC